MTHELVFTFERETKNTYRYQEVAEERSPIVGTLYVQKWALGTRPPQRIRLTIAPTEGESE